MFLILLSIFPAIALLYARVGGEQGIVTSEMFDADMPPKAFPIVNSHWHLGGDPAHIDLAVKVMDETGVDVSVDLSGGEGEGLAAKIRLAESHPGRFVFFGRRAIEAEDLEDADIGRKLADSLEACVEAGAAGWGEMGAWSNKGWPEEFYRRLAPFWERAVELNAPLNWHTAEPARYWRPETPYNRMEGEGYHGGGGKCQHAILRERDRVLERYPDLVVIAAHSSFAADRVPYLVYLMEKHPNFHIDLSASLEEWGKRPHEFYDFCMDYQDRILYGTDWGVHKKALEVAGSPENMIADWKAFAAAHYAFLGTERRWIPCPFGGNQGRWIGYRLSGFPRYYHDGANLPGDVLEKIYYKNASRLFGLDMKGVRG